jgi:hypothetical protein
MSLEALFAVDCSESALPNVSFIPEVSRNEVQTRMDSGGKASWRCEDFVTRQLEKWVVFWTELIRIEICIQLGSDVNLSNVKRQCPQ